MLKVHVEHTHFQLIQDRISVTIDNLFRIAFHIGFPLFLFVHELNLIIINRQFPAL